MAFLDTLDITDTDLMYDKLVTEIDARVLATQQFKEYRPLPSILKVTKRQQKMLRRYAQCKAMFGTKQKHWLSEHNVMEMVVQ